MKAKKKGTGIKVQKSPSTGPNMKSPSTGQNMKSPSTGPKMKSPSTGPNMKSPSTGPKKKAPSKDPKMKEDMKEILADSRFAHVAFDPKLRDIPKDLRKVKLDSRFAGVLTDDKFYEKSTMDPRGRKGNFSTKEDLLRFYQISSDESSGDEGSTSQEETESEDEYETDTDGELEEKGNEEKEKPQIAKKETGIANELSEKLQDLTHDYARGECLYSDDSSDDDSSTTDEDDIQDEFEWGELDHDAVWDTEGNEVEETSRLALCNMDWDQIKAADMMKIFASFCPVGGAVKRITIYPSEFGKQRMEEESRKGPHELVSMPADDLSDLNSVNLEKLEKGMLDESQGATWKHREALRKYQRNRLLYYYAVVECDSVNTARTLFKECDRTPFEETGILIDLRYIPDDMTFDEEVFDMCEKVPDKYVSKKLSSQALESSLPKLTWEEADPERKKALSNIMNKALKDEDLDNEQIKCLLASGSEDEEDEDLQESNDSESDDDVKSARVQKFKDLIREIDEKEKKKNEDKIDLEEMFTVEENSKVENPDTEDGPADLNPFETYLEKRKSKKKEIKNRKKVHDSEEESSDDDIPDDVDLHNDPYFAEELQKMEAEEKEMKLKAKKSKNTEDSDDEDEGERKNLELLLMEEDDKEKKHFSMREIIKNSKERKKGRKGKKKVKENAKLAQKEEDKFKINTTDSRFNQLFTAGEYNIDPSHPKFKRTKAMDQLVSDVQKRRVALVHDDREEKRRKISTEGEPDSELSNLVKKLKNKAKVPKKRLQPPSSVL